MNHNFIEIKGAKENNLKNISVKIPKNKLVVFSGLSGIGKSTLALNTLQKECQRQYMESMGMITDLISKPKVDSIVGLSPSISVDQRNSNKNPRSTVGTITEIFTYLRILFTRLGLRQCSNCKGNIYPSYENFVVDGNNYEEENYSSSKNQIICSKCGEEVTALTMSHFSFNKPEGACPICKGMGRVSSPDLGKVFDSKKSIRDGAVYEWDKLFINRYGESLENAVNYYGFKMDTTIPIEAYDSRCLALFLYGVKDYEFLKFVANKKGPKTVSEGNFEGVVTNIIRSYQSKPSKKIKALFKDRVCDACQGHRLRKESKAVTVANMNIIELSEKSLFDVLKWIGRIPEFVTPSALKLAKPIMDDLEKRVQRIIDVGLGYLSLNRQGPTLSAGEAQRLRLASLLGSGLTGVLYILDEPTAGLHSRDTYNLIKVMQKLRDLGNTVLVIEHDLEMLKAADYIVDFGPGAGLNGGEIVAFGTPKTIMNIPNSLTGKYLSGKELVSKASGVRKGNNKFLKIEGATLNNLKNINVSIPLGMFVSVTGVSGSGKSTLVFDILNVGATEYFNSNIKKELLGYKHMSGFENINNIIRIDQSPIGRTPRSNAATYTEVFKDIRNFCELMSRNSGQNIKAKDFSFNVPGGRCEKCQGAGAISVPMHFLPDVEIICPQCKGRRFQNKILKIKYQGHSIADILKMTIAEACSVFADIPQIYKPLEVLKEVGLGYLILGQPATTVSGGEAQRIKLAKELSKTRKGRILYLLDELTTGLHPHDTKKLLDF